MEQMVIIGTEQEKLIIAELDLLLNGRNRPWKTLKLIQEERIGFQASGRGSNGTVTIRYHRLNELCRAYFTVCCRAEGELCRDYASARCRMGAESCRSCALSRGRAEEESCREYAAPGGAASGTYAALCRRTEDALFIEEACAFEEMGVMLDCSRNAVPTVKALKKMIRLTAAMGYTFVGLYTEDTLEVKEEPYFGYMRGRFTRDEIREADAYAHLFGMELRPYIQTLAHMNQIIRYQKYQEITDTNDILLMEDVKTFELLDHILKAVSECYQTRKINIGMDEAEMVGLGKYLQLHGYQNRPELMRKHLERVLQLCRKYQFEPQMWSDMFFKLAFDGQYYLPEENFGSDSQGGAAESGARGLLRNPDVQQKLAAIQIPEGLEIVYWDYYHLSQNYYEQMLEAHQMLSERTAFAGGAWKWSGLVPHNRYSIRAGAAAFAACRKKNVKSVTVTCWGDNGAEADLFSILPTLFMDAQYAYGHAIPADGNSGQAASSDVNEADAFRISKCDSEQFEALTGYSFEEFLKLDEANIYVAKGSAHPNPSKYLFFDDPLIGTFSSLADEKTIPSIRKAEQELRELSKKTSEFAYLFETEAALCKVLAEKLEISERIRTAYQEKDKKKLSEIAKTDIPELVSKLDLFYQNFRKQWYENAKSFGFEVQAIRIGGLHRRLLDAALLIEEFVNGEREKIEELEEERLSFAYRSEAVEDLDFNIWSVNASPASMG